MAISFVAAGTAGTGVNPTVGVPTGYAASDLLIIFVTSTVTPTTPTGWTGIVNYAVVPRLFACYKIATASESSVTITAANSTTNAVMLAYRGASGYDVIGTGSNASSTTISTNSLTTTKANDFVISFYGGTAASLNTWTAPASTNTRFNVSSNGTVRGLLIVDELQASAGASTSRTATSSASTFLSASSISIYPTVTNNGSFFFLM